MARDPKSAKEEMDMLADKAVDAAMERRKAKDNLLLEKEIAAEQLRVAKLDVDRTFQAGQQLFQNAVDYMRKVILPVHKDHELLGQHTKILDLWLSVIEEWSQGIGIGNDVDWDHLQEKIKDIQKLTGGIYKKEEKFRDDKLKPLLATVKEKNEKVAALSKT